ncbi:MAG: hypothetical protein ABW173_11860 [Sphingomonas sp.]
MMRRFGAVCALIGLAAATPAAAGCWTAPEREAAQIRELQTMLMVAALRCHAVGIEITGDYNGFVRASRPAIEAANLRIKTHFAADGGTQADYDRFTTALANAYGDAQTDAATCAEAVEIARAGAAPAAALAHLAANRLFPRALPGDTCAASPAVASPAPATPAVIIAAAAPPAVVRLPDEVVAALAVMARYGARPLPAATAEAPTRLAAVSR